MKDNYLLSVIIPARNEMFLKNTVDDLLKNKGNKTEIIIGLDGQWSDPPIEDHLDVTIVYYPQSIGQRAMTNQCVRLSHAKWIMKVDAHCAFDEGFDVKLMADIQDDWTMIPALYNLHAFNWKCKKCGNIWYQGPTPKFCCQDKEGKVKNEKCDSLDFEREMVWKPRLSRRSEFYRFDKSLHFQYWSAYKKRPEAQGDIVETMSAQGSCFMLTRKKYWELDICEEEFGSWGQQGVEIACKTQLSGGKVFTNKKTWYSHMFRTQGLDFGFPYPISGRQVENARKYSRDLFPSNRWEKQIYPFSWLLKKYWPIPDWLEDDLNKQIEREMHCTRSGIYSITNKTTGRIYVGSAVNLKNRFRDHIKTLKSKTHRNIYLQRTWDKYGAEDFIFEILFFCGKEKLVVREQDFIDEYKNRIGWKKMFNIDPNAGSSLGREMSEETKHKIAITKIGKSPSEETRKKLSEALRGRVLTEEHRNKLINSPRFAGHNHSGESKKRIGESVKLTMDGRARNDSGQFIVLNKGIIYYTENQLNWKLAHKCRKQILKAGLPIVSTSLKPMDFGTNIVLPLKKGYEAYFRQILTALEASKAEIIFFCEHDFLYSLDHFNFTPPKNDTFYYNWNWWRVRSSDGYAVHYDTQLVPGIVAYKELLVDYYKQVVAYLEKVGFTSENANKIGFEPGTHKRVDFVGNYKVERFDSKYPILDIRHDSNLTASKWSQDDFRSPKNCQGWIEGDLKSIPGWNAKTNDFSIFLKHL